jgi:hypothetical protein
MKKLILSDNNKITDEGIIKMINMKKLNLSSNIKITDEGIK